MPTICAFQLDRPNFIYNSGEYINGRIMLKTDKPKRVNAVYVTLEGEAKVQWSISGGKSETANYFGHQQYLYTRANVFDSTEFRAGTHVYVLSLRIPPDCPTSCKGPYGYIAYNISVTIDRPWNFDEVFRKPIHVVQTLDLNFNPEFSLPVKDENIKYLCRWPCESGPICSTLILPFSGFTPAKMLPFFLEVDNQSPHYDVVGIEASLKQHFVFLARRPLKRNYHTKKLAKCNIDEYTLRLTKRLYEGNIRVPEDIPRSTLNPNYIVFLHYTLQVKLRTGCCHYDTDISVPVIIGTIPLQSSSDSVVTSQPQSMRARVMPLFGVNYEDEDGREVVEEVHFQDDEPPSYDSCLPPSFSFATLGSKQSLEPNLPIVPREQKRLSIKLPKFPGYNTFTSTTTPQAAEDSGLELNLYDSSNSLATDHTGRSLDTNVLESCSDILDIIGTSLDNIADD